MTTAEHEGAEELLEIGVLSEQTIVAQCPFLFPDERPLLSVSFSGVMVCLQILALQSQLVSGVPTCCH